MVIFLIMPDTRSLGSRGDPSFESIEPELNPGYFLDFVISVLFVNH
jgi:hypothetical protein